MRKTTKVTAELTRAEALNLGSVLPSDATNITLSQKKESFLLRYEQVEGEPAKPATSEVAAKVPGVAEAEEKLETMKAPKKP